MYGFRWDFWFPWFNMDLVNVYDHDDEFWDRLLDITFPVSH